MGHGRYIGRIGALAVALGIGAVLTASPAWADPESSSTGSVSAAADDGASKDTETAATGDDPRDTEGSADERETQEVAAPDGEVEEPSKKSRRNDRPDPYDDHEVTPATPDDETGELTPRRDESEDRVTTPETTRPPAPHQVSEAEADTPAPKPATVTRALTPAVVPPLGDSAPEAPAHASLVFSLFGVARRSSESEESSFNAAVPNNSPTLVSAKAGKPSFFSSRITGRVRVSDPDGDKLTFTVMTPENGSATVNSRGSFTYTPTAAFRHQAAAFEGVLFDRVSIIASDGNGGTVTAHFDLPVRPANVRPSARATVGKANPATGVVAGKITVTDRDGDAVVFSAPGTTARGSVVIGADGTFVYTPTTESRQAATSWFKRTDRFTVTVDDGHGGIDTVTVRVRISPPGSNRAPTVSTPGFVLNGFGDTDGMVEGYVDVTDPDGFALTYTVTGVDPNIGSVSVDASSGRFVFVPTLRARETAHGTAGEDTVRFTVTASDGSATAAVEVTVPISPKAPAATDTLQSGAWLEVGKYLQSGNGRYRLYMQGDGNLVLYDEAQNHKALWATSTNGRPGAHAAMQGDGNLVVYSGSTGVWSSKTNGWNGARLVVQSDGNLVIYAGSTAVWDRHAGVLRNPPSSSSGLRWPLANPQVNRYFGGSGHNGIDLKAGINTPVYAAADGVISFEGYGKYHSWMTDMAGISILIWHPSLNIYTGYAHLSSTVINNGQTVTRGQLIGYSGYSGYVIPAGPAGAHLHFEVLPKTPNFQNGYSGRINPLPYIQ